MKPALAMVVFYFLLALAVMVMRGDLTGWPRAVDRALAWVVVLGAAVVLLRSWKARQPLAGPAGDGSSRPRSMWLWWAGLAGLAALVFLAVLPPVSVVLARPLSVERTTEGRESPGPRPPSSADGPIARPDAAGLNQEPGAGAGAARQSGSRGGQGWRGRLSALAERYRELMHSRPPWFLALLMLLFLLAAILLWWLLRRARRPGAEEAADAPRPPWHNDPDAPAYVREFCRLCEHLGHPPRPGDTWRDLLARLPAAAAPPPALEPVAVYHYRVRYEGAAADRAAEREYAGLIRAARKAAIVPPATGTVTAGSAAR